MASSLRFLHGAETNVANKGPRFFQPVNSSVGGLVGTAPVHLLPAELQTPNVLGLVWSDQRSVQLYGVDRPGFTMPSAFRATYIKTGGQFLAVNVFDPAVHKQDVAAAEMTFAGGTIQLANEDVTAITVQSQDLATTYVDGTDYTVDRATGLVSRVTTGGIAQAATVSIAYSYADLTLVTSADIIGGVDIDGNRSGLELLKEGLITYGRKAKLIQAPGFASVTAVRNAMQSIARNQRGHCFVDAPIGTTPAEAIQSRGPTGPADVFFTSDKRTMLCYPHVKEYDANTDSDVLAPYSQHLAAVSAQVQSQRGLQYSPSNKEILGITGVEVNISSDFTDPDSEANQLNEFGITTIYRGFGTGSRTWGNRTAAWPTDTGVDTFLAVQAVSDMIAETLEFNSLQFIDQPLTLGLIDSVVKSVDSFLGRLKNQGIILNGKVWFDAADNDATQLSAGWIRFRVDQQQPPPTERLTYEQEFNIGYLAELAEQAAAAYGAAA